MDCLLIQPPLTTLFNRKKIVASQFDIPRGILSLASFLVQNNKSVKVLPFDYYLDDTCSNSFFVAQFISEEHIKNQSFAVNTQYPNFNKHREGN